MQTPSIQAEPSRADCEVIEAPGERKPVDEAKPDRAAPASVMTFWLRPADQRVVGALTLAGLTALALHWLMSGGFQGRIVDIDQATELTAKFTVDVNAAPWPELALLPDIGETIARRVVEHRQKRGPFQSLDDLDAVRGIGPKTLDRIKPYLRPIQEEKPPPLNAIELLPSSTPPRQIPRIPPNSEDRSSGEQAPATGQR